MKRIIKFECEQYCLILFVLYMCRTIIHVFDIGAPLFILLAYYFATVLMVIFIVIIVIQQPKRLPKDFLLLMISVIIFFEITCRLHPEYEIYIFDEFWSNVLSFDGIWGYFIVRFINNEKLIERGLKISAPILFFASFIHSLGAISRGYWYILYNGNVQRSNYNMSFGYSMLVPSIIFLYYGMKERKGIYILATIIGMLEIVMLGSRAAVLGIPMMVLIYIILCEHDMKRKNRLIIIISMFLFGIIMILFFRQILSVLDSIFKIIGFSSRTIQRMIEGSLSEDRVRDGMYSRAVILIKNNFWGYGMLADRYYFGVYCHNIVYEILLQFGLILGVILLIVFSVLTIKVLVGRDDSIKGIFLIFFCICFFRLLVSHSFWVNQYFWCAIGLAVTYKKAITNDRKVIRIKVR